MNKILWEETIKFHGHRCPGLAIGFRACEVAMEKMNLTFSADEDVVCITENDACGVDAIQFVTGCTIGKGNLILRSTGKMAFSFFDRHNGNSLRLMFKPSHKKMDRDQSQEYLLNAPIELLFDIKKPNYSLPVKARSFATIICEQCGEGAPEHKIRINTGQKVCLDCFEDYSRGW